MHPHGSCGKNHCWNSPVGACPETSLVKRLKVVISPAMLINCLPLPSQALGSINLHCFFNFSDFVSAKVDQVECHSIMANARLCRIPEAMVCAGKGGGPMMVASTA